MFANCPTLDESFISNARIQRTIQRLRTIESGGSARWRLSRLGLGSLGGSILMKRPTAESVEGEDALSLHLVARSKSGDADAMEFLIKRYQSRVAGFVFVSVGDGQAVEDLCQTIFYKMLLGLRRLRDDEKFEPWLFRIARNACFDYLRRRRLRRIFVPWQMEDNEMCVTESSADPTNAFRLDAFRRALAMLPQKQRELVALLQDDQLTYEQLASITNSSVSSVKSRLFRARRRLRKSMGDEE